LLGDGRVLVIAGADTADTAQKNTYFGTISGDTISWANGTDITTTMYEHTATLLQDGRVMTVGGVNAATSNTNLTYFGTISSNTITWAAGTVYGTVIAGATANLLPNGHVLVCGGTNGSPVTTTNFLSISTNTITYTAGTVIPATFATGNSVMLPDGQVLLVGGIGGAASQKCYSASISEPDLVWNQAKSMTITRRLSGVVVSGNRLVIVGGSSSSTSAVVEMIPLEVKIIKT
jgi:hypothetical protein